MDGTITNFLGDLSQYAVVVIATFSFISVLVYIFEYVRRRINGGHTTLHAAIAHLEHPHKRNTE